MTRIARIIGLSLLTGGLGLTLGFAFFRQYSDWSIPALGLACASAIIGAVAGAAREIGREKETR